MNLNLHFFYNQEAIFFLNAQNDWTHQILQAEGVRCGLHVSPARQKWVENEKVLKYGMKTHTAGVQESQ